MKKSLLLCMMMVVGGQVSFPQKKIPPLTSIIVQQLFTFKNDQDKKAFNQKLIDKKINPSELKFEKVRLKDMDLSGMHLKGIDFSGCRFIRVNLKNTDLTETRWDRVKLDDIKSLKGAILYNHDTKLIIDVDDNNGLIKKYSDLRLQIREKNFDGSDPELKVLCEKAECLNKIIGSLNNFQPIDNLSNMDITGIRLTRMRLMSGSYMIHPSANIEGVWLSRETQVSFSRENDRTNLFEKWASGVEGYQLLWNMGFNFIKGVDPELIRRTLEEKVKAGVDLSNGYLFDTNLRGAHLENANLENTNLYSANLQGAHLENAQLKNAILESTNLQGAHLENAQLKNTNLYGTNLRGAHLENANLKNANLYNANLREAWLSEKEQVSNYLYHNRTDLFEKWASGIKEYQPLWNAKFDFIRGVDSELVRRTLEEKVKSGVDLSNGYLRFAHLQGAHLEKAQLKNADLYGANLQEAHLENAQLKNADLEDAHLQRTHLKGTDLRGAGLALQFRIPYYDKEEDLIGVYDACQDQVAKGQLRYILIGKELVAKDF